MPMDNMGEKFRELFCQTKQLSEIISENCSRVLEQDSFPFIEDIKGYVCFYIEPTQVTKVACRYNEVEGIWENKETVFVDKVCIGKSTGAFVIALRVEVQNDWIEYRLGSTKIETYEFFRFLQEDQEFIDVIIEEMKKKAKRETKLAEEILNTGKKFAVFFKLVNK